jgi:hypothetical protein
MYRQFLALAGLSLAVACDTKDTDLETVMECADICVKVEECGVTPPSMEIGNLSNPSDVGAVDCAANCVQPERAFYGYSDCQMTCLSAEGCGTMEDCWDVSSDAFATYCLEDVETTPVEAPEEEAEAIDNNTNTGSEDADDIVDNPAVEEAVEDNEFDVNYGSNPPIIAGIYDVNGSIDESSNARPEGSPIITALCFWGQDTLSTEAGAITNYCETAVPGELQAPITGDATTGDFTMYFEYPGAATILFSGTVNEDGTMSQVEALVVYLHGMDIWEHSYTDWAPTGDCSGC